MQHVSWTHRVNLDWLLERSFIDPSVYCRYIETKQQLADILTKPNFSASDWCNLCTSLRVGPIGSHQRLSQYSSNQSPIVSDSLTQYLSVSPSPDSCIEFPRTAESVDSLIQEVIKCQLRGDQMSI